MTNDKQRLILFGIVLFGLEVGLVLWASIPWLLGQANADDFYYYLVLAKNSAAGLGPTFDGFEITNGFHPLYLLMLVPLASLPIESPIFLIKSALILLLIFHNLTGVIIATGFWRLGQRHLGWLMALAWLLNPWGLAITLHGVEVPIVTALWAIITLRIYTRRHQGQPLLVKEAVILGTLSGLAVLARTDSVFLVAAVCATELYRSWRLAKQPWLTPFVIGLVSLIVTAPWWWWTWHNFGALMQVSGKAVFLGIHAFDWQKPEIVLPNIGSSAILYFGRLLIYNLAAFVMVAFVIWSNRARKTSSRSAPIWPEIWRHLDFAIIAALIIAGWYVLWQWHIQNWYLLSTTFVVTMVIGVFLSQRRVITQQVDLVQAAGLIVLVNILILIGIYMTIGFGFPKQARGYEIAQWLNGQIDPNAPVEDRLIGVWNSGIVGYFSHNPVINLDGVVNNQVYAYKIEHRVTDVGGLMGYIEQRGITYLTDYEFLYFADPAAMGLIELYESAEHGFRVYQRVDK